MIILDYDVHLSLEGKLDFSQIMRYSVGWESIMKDGDQIVEITPTAKDKPLRRVVLPAKATKRFEEIFKMGGVIKMITVSYSLPCKPGFVSSGQSFFSGEEVNGIEIK